MLGTDNNIAELHGDVTTEDAQYMADVIGDGTSPDEMTAGRAGLWSDARTDGIGLAADMMTVGVELKVEKIGTA